MELEATLFEHGNGIARLLLNRLERVHGTLSEAAASRMP
jgi:hypothetical protein